MSHLNRRSLLGLASLAGLGWRGSKAFADGDPSDVLAGTWTYRSFLNDPDINKAFNDLRFAAAVITLEKAPFGKVKGKLAFGDDYLGLTGAASYGNPFTLRFQGVGATPGTIEDGKPWVYDYLGYVVPDWPGGVGQRAAIVGSVVRTVPHSMGQAKAGFVASFIAVRQDP